MWDIIINAKKGNGSTVTNLPTFSWRVAPRLYCYLWHPSSEKLRCAGRRPESSESRLKNPIPYLYSKAFQFFLFPHTRQSMIIDDGEDQRREGLMRISLMRSRYGVNCLRQVFFYLDHFGWLWRIFSRGWWG